MFNSTWIKTKVKSTVDSSCLNDTGKSNEPKSTYEYFKGYKKDFFKLDGIYAFYLGFAITTFGAVSITTWQWWAIVVPTIMMINFFKKGDL